MAFDYLHVNDLDTATLDDTDQIIVGEGNTFKKATLANLKGSIIGSDAEYTEDTVPYLSARQTKNAGIVGKVAMEQLVGGSFGWNQLTRYSNGSSTVSGVTYTVTDGNRVSMSGTATADSILHGYTFDIFAEHVYAITGGKSRTIYATATGSANWYVAPVDYGSGAIGKARATVRPEVALVVLNGTTASGSTSIQCTDLTLALGSTIADYIYSLEQATAGSGIAKLKSWGIDLDTYHAYDAGSIQSVEATSHVTTGFNQWDEQWRSGYYNATGTFVSASGYVACANPIAVLPNTTYNLTSRSGYMGRACWYDGNMNFISTNTSSSSATTWVLTSPSNARYLNFDMSGTYGSAYKGDVCINISKTSGSPKNGDYVPYSGHTYPLGSDTLRGIPQLVNNELQYDGDVKTADGTITRKYGIRAYQSGDVSDGSTMLTDGTNTVYKLTTPTTEISTAYQRIQTVDVDGTESFVANTVVPVGHVTQIPENVLGALSVLVG